MQVSDLKLYTGALDSNTKDNKALNKKIWGLGKTYSFKGDEDFGLQHHIIGLNLRVYLITTILHEKDYIILCDGAIYNTQQGPYKNSEALLIALLKGLYWFWITLLPVISEMYKYYPELGGEFGELEYSFLDVGFNILPAMDEIINILNETNSKFIFERNTNPMRARAQVTVTSLWPNSVNDPAWDDTILHTASKEELIQIILWDNLKTKKEYNEVLYLWMQRKLEYKFRIKEQNLSQEGAIRMFLKEFESLSLGTIKFLCVNFVMDLDKLRELELERQRLLRKDSNII